MMTLKEKSDERLIALYVDGNNDAFDVLIDRHKDRVYSIHIFYILSKIQNWPTISFKRRSSKQL